ncbi:hypothetical protein BDW42DRAFT_22322 [Aspergillus taichungensis]|uniref:Uncharacterized protein n=1 Tax=Aspergillus taichungensis TaxID=482145 RepID=A0A2J5HH83_9EURO|nr:hypothetical protein BDW42DRAFT_22322 [Aspergillus taichungensis]
MLSLGLFIPRILLSYHIQYYTIVDTQKCSMSDTVRCTSESVECVYFDISRKI